MMGHNGRREKAEEEVLWDYLTHQELALSVGSTSGSIAKLCLLSAQMYFLNNFIDV